MATAAIHIQQKLLDGTYVHIVGHIPGPLTPAARAELRQLLNLQINRLPKKLKSHVLPQGKTWYPGR